MTRACPCRLSRNPPFIGVLPSLQTPPTPLVGMRRSLARAYAWSHLVGDVGERRGFYAVPHLGGIRSPLDAVRARRSRASRSWLRRRCRWLSATSLSMKRASCGKGDNREAGRGWAAREMQWYFSALWSSFLISSSQTTNGFRGQFRTLPPGLRPLRDSRQRLPGRFKAAARDRVITHCAKRQPASAPLPLYAVPRDRGPCASPDIVLRLRVQAVPVSVKHTLWPPAGSASPRPPPRAPRLVRRASRPKSHVGAGIMSPSRFQ